MIVKRFISKCHETQNPNRLRCNHRRIPNGRITRSFLGRDRANGGVNAFQGSFSEVRLCGAYSQLLDPFATCFCCISPRNLILWIPFPNHLGSFDFWRKTLGKHLVIAPRFVVMVIQSVGNILQDSDACNFLEIWKTSKQTFRIYLRRGQKNHQNHPRNPFWSILENNF